MSIKGLRSTIPLEGVFWLTSLGLLYVTDPMEHHFSLCPLDNAGFHWCPGCGIGRSISLLMHGELEASVGMHWFGIPAFLVILHRIYIVSKQVYFNWKNKGHYGQSKQTNGHSGHIA